MVGEDIVASRGGIYRALGVFGPAVERRLDKPAVLIWPSFGPRKAMERKNKATCDHAHGPGVTVQVENNVPR